MQALLQSICWGLSDAVLFIAHDRHLFTIDTATFIPSLAQLCLEYIAADIQRYKEYNSQQLPLPSREINKLNLLCRPLLTVSNNN